MIVVLLGTRAQLIKMAPVILELERRGWAPRLILTGQHKETMDRLLADFGIGTPPVLLHDGREINGIGQVLPWFAKCLWRLWRDAKPLLGRGRSPGVILVHGDTFSTLLGALAGRMAGLTVAHVESGLRSFSPIHPFPEELTRLAVFRLADLAFCPDDWAANNLVGYRLRVIDTGGNTLLDALRLALTVNRPLPLEPPPGAFGVISLHRFENIFRKEQLRHILSLVEDAAERHRLVFVLHPATRRNLEKFSLLARLEGNPRISLWSRMGYFEFVSLISRATFVITDGGSNQEELSYLDKPTLLMRQATERQEGVGRNVVLSGFDRNRLLAFLDGLAAQPSATVDLGCNSPSKTIADALSGFRLSP